MKDYDYAFQAKHYDILEENPSIEAFNYVLDGIFKKHKAKSVLDITCGTGAQAIYLDEKGYDVTASDLSEEMVAIAQKKYPKIDFKQADMRSVNFGEFDAVISIFNAIGHLSEADFQKSVQNIASNLKPGGLYIFDIFNFDFMKNNFIPYEFIDTCTEIDGMKYVRFNKNKLDEKKQIMTMNQKTFFQEDLNKPKVVAGSYDLQIYSSVQLKNILEEKGFEVVEFLAMDGKAFDKENDLSVLTVARKK